MRQQISQNEPRGWQSVGDATRSPFSDRRSMNKQPFETTFTLPLPFPSPISLAGTNVLRGILSLPFDLSRDCNDNEAGIEGAPKETALAGFTAW